MANPKATLSEILSNVLTAEVQYEITLVDPNSYQATERTSVIRNFYQMYAENGVEYHGKATNGNQKLGKAIFNINLPVIITCNPDAPCKRGCYATRGNFLYENVRKCQNTNLFAFIQNPKQFFDDIADQTKLCLYVRWFGSGDMPNMEFFKGMIRVAKKNPKVIYLAFTKQYRIVNEFVAQGGKIPRNLKVAFSTWMEWIPENPYNFPTTWVRFDPNKKCEAELARFNQYIPKKAFKCPNKCANCLKCWQLKKGESVEFKKH